MNDIKELLERIKKEAKDKDAIYLYGVEYSSNTKPGFKAMVRFSKEVPPVVFASDTKAKLKRSIQSYLNGTDVKDVNILYHYEQIAIEQKAINFHKNLIKQYEDTSTELPTE